MESLAQTMNISKMALDDNFTNSSFKCSIGGFKQVIYPTMYLIIFFLGAVGNGVSIYVFFQPSQRISVNKYMQSSAILDLMFVSTLPFWATYFLLGSRWIFGNILRRIITYTLYVNMYCSIYFLTVLSVVCFIAIIYPFKYGKVTNSKYARITYTAIWIFMLAATSTLLSKGVAGYSTTVKCLDLHPSNTHRLFMMNSFVVSLILPFCTIVVCYVFAIRALLKSRTLQSNRVVYHKKALLTIIITLILFLLCFLPYHILQSRTSTVHPPQDTGLKGNCLATRAPLLCFIILNQ
ncbi:cysteinyl leukotriene receptor 2 [Neopelma chrysocephalum]|uniref:cysteinyl leukotriene receptor 2 n=1 Tax=Neopelma chrysocephalum TaxID=114329 RepID=UPI000FCD2215|nr:cysteinyl leukotriene receptor 2 [Neopelma chrysocephalum]